MGEIVFSRSPSINNIQIVSNFYGVDSEMLSSEKSIFENYDCGDPRQRNPPPGGGYSQKNWVGVCGPLPKTLTRFMTSLQANL